MSSPVRSLLFVATLGCTLALVAHAGERAVQTIKFGDPSKPGTFRAELPWATLKIRGTDTTEVRIASTVPQKNKIPRDSDGLRRLDDTPSFEVLEKDNVVTLQLGGDTPWAQDAEFEVEVPRNTALLLSAEAGGDLTVENVEGDIEASSMNGEVILQGLAGSAVVNTMNGEIRVSYKTVPKKSVSLSSLNGEISLGIPASTKANLRMRTHNGAVYTDFDENSMTTRTEGRGGSLDPEMAKAISQTTREAMRVAADATRMANEISREVSQEVRRAVAQAREDTDEAAESLKAPKAPKTPKAPKAPKIPRTSGSAGDFGVAESLIGSKTVTGTLNGGGTDIQISSMNGTITIRQIK